MSQAQIVDVRPFPHLQRWEQLKRDFARSLYARATNNEVAFRWINRDFVRGLRETAPPPLSSAGERVVKDLSADGFALANFSEFFAPGFFNEIKGAFDGYREEFDKTNANRKIKGKAVFLDTIHRAHTFTLTDPVSKYLSSPEFAAISAKYMGMVPRYVGSSFWHTKPAPGNRQDSQLWHRDYNDRRLVKIFLYLNDVGHENGYFEYVTGTHINGPYGRQFDAIGPNGYRQYPDQQLLGTTLQKIPTVQLDKISEADRSGDRASWHKNPSVVQCQAPAGTLIFADTFGIHRGGYIKNGHRDMIMTTFSTNFNVHKPHFSVTSEFADSLNPFMKMVFGVA